MPRPFGRVLGAAFALALPVHLALALHGFHERWFQANQWEQNLVWLGLLVLVALFGRLYLSLFPPGPTGSHDLLSLPETAATSLALGWAVACAAALPLVFLLVALNERGGLGSRTFLIAYASAAIVVPGLVRWATLPGAMVPRHTPAREDFGRARVWLVGAALAFLGFALFTRAFVAAAAWLALGILLERALACAGRAALPRAAFLCAFAGIGFPGPSGWGEEHGLIDEFGLAAALGAGAAFLVPWLRRADKRAGLLAAVFFAAPLMRAWNGVAWAGVAVLVAASHRAQRRFALTAAACTALPCALLGLSLATRGRGRLLLAEELARLALEHEVWGLAWPLAVAAIVLGALTFPWKGAAWQPGTLEEPRRESVALGALVLLVALQLTPPSSPWFEPEALLVLFPLVALLGGLLLLPPERRPASA